MPANRFDGRPFSLLSLRNLIHCDGGRGNDFQRVGGMLATRSWMPSTTVRFRRSAGCSYHCCFHAGSTCHDSFDDGQKRRANRGNTGEHVYIRAEERAYISSGERQHRQLRAVGGGAYAFLLDKSIASARNLSGSTRVEYGVKHGTYRCCPEIQY